MEQDVNIARLEIPFWHLVGFLVKLTLATIPAAIIVALVYLVVTFFLLGLVQAS